MEALTLRQAQNRALKGLFCIGRRKNESILREKKCKERELIIKMHDLLLHPSEIQETYLCATNVQCIIFV